MTKPKENSSSHLHDTSSSHSKYHLTLYPFIDNLSSKLKALLQNREINGIQLRRIPLCSKRHQIKHKLAIDRQPILTRRTVRQGFVSSQIQALSSSQDEVIRETWAGGQAGGKVDQAAENTDRDLDGQGSGRIEL